MSGAHPEDDRGVEAAIPLARVGMIAVTTLALVEAGLDPAPKGDEIKGTLSALAFALPFLAFAAALDHLSEVFKFKSPRSESVVSAADGIGTIAFLLALGDLAWRASGSHVFIVVALVLLVLASWLVGFMKKRRAKPPPA